MKQIITRRSPAGDALGSVQTLPRPVKIPPEPPLGGAQRLGAGWPALLSATRVSRARRCWHHPGLAAVLLLSAALNLYHLDRVGYGNQYYAAAVLSMLQSWHNLFFVSFDPGGFVSVDKPPLGFWIQAASAKVLGLFGVGYSGFSVLLPEALAG